MRTKSGLSSNTLANFCKELGTLLGAGVPLARGLSILEKDESMRAGDRAVFSELLRLIGQGTALSEAMESMGWVFPPMMIYMFRAAETSGNLGAASKRLGEYYTKKHRLDVTMKSATAYPKLLCVLIVVIVAALTGFVLPQFESLFSMIEVLPLPTRILYGIMDVLTRYWYLLVSGFVVGSLAVSVLSKKPAIRLQIDKLKLYVPVVGKLLEIVYTARFARTLSSLHAAGVPIMTVMEIARNSVGNTYIHKQLDDVISQIQSGSNLSSAIGTVHGFVKKLGFSIQIGEETGSLDTMLDSIAEALEYDAEMVMKQVVSYLEPILLICMALIVGFIMIAVLLPIYESYSAIEMAAY